MFFFSNNSDCIYVCGARSRERGPHATPAHYEINGRDLKSGKLDAARAREGGTLRSAPLFRLPIAAQRARRDVEGRTTAPPDIIFSLQTLFSFFPTRPTVQPTAEVK